MEAVEREIFEVPAGVQSAVNTISLDSCSNRVIIRFADHDYPALREALAEKYGDLVVFGVEPRSQPL